MSGSAISCSGVEGSLDSLPGNHFKDIVIPQFSESFCACLVSDMKLLGHFQMLGQDYPCFREAVWLSLELRELLEGKKPPSQTTTMKHAILEAIIAMCITVPSYI